MHVMETGILYKARPLVSIGLFGKGIDKRTKEGIFHGIYSMIAELFKDQALKMLDVAGFTVFFWGFHPFTPNNEDAGGLDDLVLDYAVVDLEGDKIDDNVKAMITGKLHQITAEFAKHYGGLDAQAVETTDFSPFIETIWTIFRDLPKSPRERFDSFFGS